MWFFCGNIMANYAIVELWPLPSVALLQYMYIQCILMAQRKKMSPKVISITYKVKAAIFIPRDGKYS